MTPPKVSVVMSVYNGERYLREAVESILNQTFKDFEFIIVDDASEDNTWQILKEFSLKDCRILLVRNTENIGLTRSLNKGLARAVGQYVARQDADDVSLPNRFAKQVECLDNQPEVALVSSNIQFIDSKGHLLRQSRRTGDPDLVAWYLVFYNHVAGHSVVMFRRKTVMDLGGYSESYRYGQDHELWLRLVEVGDIVVLPDVLLQWRRHDENISFKANQEQEAFSLHATSQRISRLIGKEISLSEAQELRQFWLGQFSDGKKFATIHSRLKQIHGQFLRRRAEQRWFHAELSLRLRRLIAEQFFDCSRMINIRKRLLLGLKGLPYAVTWHPRAGLTRCFKENLMLPFRLSRALARRLFSEAGSET